MTPFGIRKKLKSLMGLDTSADDRAPVKRPERPKVTLVLVDDRGKEQTFSGDVGSSPLYISGNMERPIASGCNDSSCGTCRIEVIEGAEHLSPQSPREKQTLAANGFPTTLRLGCCSEITGGTLKVRAYNFVDV